MPCVWCAIEDLGNSHQAYTWQECPDNQCQFHQYLEGPHAPQTRGCADESEGSGNSLLGCQSLAHSWGVEHWRTLREDGGDLDRVVHLNFALWAPYVSQWLICHHHSVSPVLVVEIMFRGYSW